MLLFYDGSAEAKSALFRCAELSVALAALVDVVTVVDFLDANAICAGMLTDVAATQMEEQARSGLKDAIDELGLNGVAARGHVAFGRVADAISQMTELLKSDVMVVGHRTRTRFARWYSDRPLHVDLVERVKGTMIVTVTPT
ncbi:universal stress protein [Paraburkholderia sp. RL18-103-BIB-C]|uniref:universal stress protein n=1 Tax=unclassified Paraburkholderia TaxID=2615204 RepID=UPI0038B804DD